MQKIYKHLSFFSVSVFMLLLGTWSHNAYADCWYGACYGYVAADANNGQATSGYNLGHEDDARHYIRKFCEGRSNCESQVVRNGCIAAAYSPSHKFVVMSVAGGFNTGTSVSKHAMESCYARIKQLGIARTGGDTRRSGRRTNETGTCQVVQWTCTDR